MSTDSAKNGYYTIEPYKSGRWLWRVTGYTKTGELLVQTVHADCVSKNNECAVWESRGAKFREFA